MLSYAGTLFQTHVKIQILMKTHRSLSALLLCAAAFFSCEDNTNDDATEVQSGTFIINNGNWGSNDSNIGIYNPDTRTFTPEAFLTVNDQQLGDLCQDIIRHGNDIYIAVNGSQTIFITDHNLKVRKQITASWDGNRLSPKSFAASADKVYVTYYEGFIGEISPAEDSVRLCPVGPNPEGIALTGNNLYVANSGGMAYPDYNNTISVVSLPSFTESSTIDVNLNPAKIEASSDGKHIYVSSFGNFDDIPARLQIMETSTGKVTDLEYTGVSSIAKGKDDILYILCGGYDENWNPLPGTIYRHDMASDTALGTFITDGTTLPDAYSISATSDGYVYVGCSDYLTTGDMYVFTSDGKLHDRFDSQGLNPLKAYR